MENPPVSEIHGKRFLRFVSGGDFGLRGIPKDGYPPHPPQPPYPTYGMYGGITKSIDPVVQTPPVAANDITSAAVNYKTVVDNTENTNNNDAFGLGAYVFSAPSVDAPVDGPMVAASNVSGSGAFASVVTAPPVYAPAAAAPATATSVAAASGADVPVVPTPDIAASLLAADVAPKCGHKCWSYDQFAADAASFLRMSTMQRLSIITCTLFGTGAANQGNGGLKNEIFGNKLYVHKLKKNDTGMPRKTKMQRIVQRL